MYERCCRCESMLSSPNPNNPNPNPIPLTLTLTLTLTPIALALQVGVRCLDGHRVHSRGDAAPLVSQADGRGCGAG